MTDGTDTATTDAYLRRLGVERPARPTPDALRELHLRHLRTVPFENLSVHLGEEIVLDEDVARMARMANDAIVTDG